MAQRTVSHAQILENVMRAAGARVNVALPVVVESFNPAQRTVECQPQVHNRVGPNRLRYPKLVNVPISYPRGGGFFMGFPLQPGDLGFVVCMDHSIDEWLLLGTEIAEPADPRRHDLSDAVFIPGMSPITDPIAAFDGSDFIMGLESGGVSVRMTKTGKVAIGNEVVDLLDIIYATVSAMIGDSLVVSGSASPSGDTVAGTAVFSPPTITQVMAKLVELQAIKGA